MKKRKICIVTTSRADYGLLYWLMKAINEDRDLKLQIVAAGMHLEAEFGLTYKIIEEDGFEIDEKINMSMTDDSDIGISKSISKGCVRFASLYHRLGPDLVVLLGDRYELISAAMPAVVARVPIAHIHGGEITEGAVDNVVRHCITKMSVFHFASTETYRRRIIQMGEEPRFVVNYGAPGLDNLYRLKLFDKDKLEEVLDFDLNGTTAMITYHPVTLSKKRVETQINTVLETLDGFDFKAIFTMANADVGGSVINSEIKKFCNDRPRRCKFFKNLGQVVYLSCLKNFDVMIGNSSSGIIEASSLGLSVVNIGDRQAGRVRGANVIDVNCTKAGIRKGINLALSGDFRNKIRDGKNPYDKYGDGRTSYRIKEKLKKIKIEHSLTEKVFYDLSFNTVKV